jgi:arabinofuranan 3-O-arabinosyltransferase
LKAVTVDGWQQGFVLPAGPAAQVELTFAPDRLYRASIAGGLGLVLLLFLGSLVTGRRTSLPAAEPVRLPGWLVAGVFLVVFGAFLAGPGGVVVAGAVLAARHAQAAGVTSPAAVWGWAAAAAGLVLVAGGLMANAGRVAADSGDHGLIQLLCVTALAIVVTAGIGDPGSARPRDEPVDD